MLSYTRLAHEPDVAAIAAPPGDALALDPAEFDVDDSELDPDRAAAAGSTDLPPGADSGLLLHDVLEIADLARARCAPDAAAWLDDPEVAAQIADKARERGIAEAYLPHAAAIAHRALTAPLALIDGTALPPLVEARALAREVEFGYPIPASSPQPARRAAWSRASSTRWSRGTTSCGCSTTRATCSIGDDLAALAQDRVRTRYAVQARLYAIAADRLRGRRRLAGLLVRVRPPRPRRAGAGHRRRARGVERLARPDIGALGALGALGATGASGGAASPAEPTGAEGRP